MLRILFTVMSWLPLPMVHRLGDLLGYSLNLFSNDLRDVARINIQHCFPDWSPEKQQELVKHSLQESAKAALELGALWLWPIERVMPLIRQVSGEHLLKEAMARGKGVIFAAPHLGAWEIVGLYGSAHWPMTSLYRPPRQASMQGIMCKGRERAGATLVPTDGRGVRALYKALSRGELIGILPDQDPGRNAGVFAPFFGIQANTMTLLSRLAAQSGATVLMAYAERLPNGKGYHMHIESTEPALADADAQVAASHLNQAVERCARKLPAQYQWAYKRFKARPGNERPFY
ncbi:MAG TPA: lipid A biosynthesis acyltransferase [Gammaproteobacteria bacterium]|nr:lipid A biosynthesis acyltransferase [Gammaproteobacteria bacterium]